MTDRKMLELAAKAAGLWSHRYCEPWSAMVAYTPHDGYHGPSWNSLTDSGQALELAVKLPMRAVIDEVWVTERTSIAEWERDPLAATRLAITRAAAEIGKAMP